MGHATIPPRAGWPSFRWKDSGWWFTVSGTTAALLFFLVPRGAALDVRGRLLVCFSLLLAPSGLLLLRYLASAAKMIVVRIFYYSKVYALFEQSLARAAALEQHLSEYVGDQTRYEILAVQWHRERGDVYLVIQKKSGKPRDIGAWFTAYDRSDGRLMAELEIIEVRDRGYLAKVNGYIDPLWLGEVRDRDMPEIPPPPEVWAYIRPRQGDT